MSPRTVLITGANRGLGLEFVKQFLRLPSPPDRIFATCREPITAKNLQEVASSNPSVTVLKLDVTDPGSIREVKDEVESKLLGQGLNVLLNNGAIHIRKGLSDVTGEDMIESYKTNVVGPLLTVQTFLPLLKRAAEHNTNKGLSWDRAAIFNISSRLGSVELNTSGGLYPYRASKDKDWVIVHWINNMVKNLSDETMAVFVNMASQAALNQITRSFSNELEADGILAASFHPGWVKTDMGGASAAVTPEESIQGLLQVFPKIDGTCKGHMTDFTGTLIPW